VLDAPTANQAYGVCSNSGGTAPCQQVVSVLNPSTNQTVVSVALDNFTSNIASGNGLGPIMGPMRVAGDGNAYLPYFYQQSNTTTDGSGNTTVSVTSNLMVLEVGPDGTNNKIPLGTMGTPWTGSYTYSDSGGLLSCSGQILNTGWRERGQGRERKGSGKGSRGSLQGVPLFKGPIRGPHGWYPKSVLLGWGGSLSVSVRFLRSLRASFACPGAESSSAEPERPEDNFR
jgi:hypothetical protein